MRKLAPRNRPEPEQDGTQPLRNARHEAFCQAYTSTHARNAAASYLAAGYKAKKGHPPAVNGARLLTFANIRNRIKFLEEAALELAGISRREAVERLSVMATASIADFLDESGEVDVDKVRNGPFAAAVEDFWIQELPDGSRKCRIRLADRQKAMQLLGLTREKVAEVQQQVAVAPVLVIKT